MQTEMRTESEPKGDVTVTRSEASSVGERSRPSPMMPSLDPEVRPEGVRKQDTRVKGTLARIPADSDESSDEYLSSEEGSSEGQQEEAGPPPFNEGSQSVHAETALRDRDQARPVAFSGERERRHALDSQRAEYDEALR